MDKLSKQALLLALKGYQLMISPYLPQACRFTPTCSEYTRQAVERHGSFKGFVLGLKRLSRCHPASSGGFHPVPE
jgi:putative membrane protein insertion efficiency factor